MYKILHSKLEKELFFNELCPGQVALIPEPDFQDRNLAISVIGIKIDTQFTKYEFRNDDIWSIDGKNFFFTKPILEQIANGAGIKFISSYLMSRQVGDDKRVVFVKHCIKYEYLGADATLRQSHTTGEYCYYEDLEHLRYKEDVYAENQLINKKGDLIKGLIENRRFCSGSVAEGNCKKKALGEIFRRLKKPFTLTELKNPILVGKFIYDKETILSENPEFRSAYIAKMLDLGDSMSRISLVNKHSAFMPRKGECLPTDCKLIIPQNTKVVLGSYEFEDNIINKLKHEKES